MGDWFEFDSGPFADRVVRASLQEMQKADIGRKYARKDKRPLDPPPVVRLRCFQTLHARTVHEVEQEFDRFDEHTSFGFICHVDLFPIPIETPKNLIDRSPPASSGSGAPQFSFQQDVSMSSPRAQHPSHMSFPQADFRGGLGSGVPQAMLSFDIRDSSPSDYPRNAFDYSPESVHASWNMRSKTLPAPLSPSIADSLLYPENTRCTELLSGETFVPCSLVEYDGNKAAMFVFSDLAVKREGRYTLRYRVFNIAARERGENYIPVIAECYGGTFEIFSTKTFPGLQVSTDLTKRISLSGIRVNSRHRERKGWKKSRRSDSDEPTGPTTTHNSSMARTSGVKPMNWPQLAPFAQSFSQSHSFAYSQTSPSGLFNAGADPSRSALAAWARTSPAGMQDISARLGPCSTSTEHGSTQSLW